MKRPGHLHIRKSTAEYLYKNPGAEGLCSAVGGLGDLVYAPVNEARDTAVRELVELVRALLMESPGALSTRRFMALRDALAAIKEAD